MQRLFTLMAILATSISFASPVINYTLSMPEPHTHYFNVEMEITDIKEKFMDIKLPVWAPGSYLIREFPKSIEAFQATASGNPLKWEKTSKNTWRVYSEKKNVKITYSVYAFEMSVRTSFLDASHGYLNGTSVFMYVEGYKDLPINLKVVPFSDWKKVSTGLASGKDPYTYQATDYDVLVDSPIEIGNHLTFEFEASGVKHEVAMYGEGNFDVELLKKDMPKVVESCTSVYGQNPNERYVFIIHNLTQGSGGLEHRNSTTLQVNRWTYGEKYNDFLSLVAHEYFHLWNVKRIRPITLGPFNYNEENYTTLLWVMEGFTSYYDELLLVQAGIKEPEEQIKTINSIINYSVGSEGGKVQSLSEASFDAWIKAYRPNENSANTTVSYYTKGGLMAALMDFQILAKSEGTKDLDDVMQYLWTTYYKEAKRGFTAAEMEAAVSKVAGIDMHDFFEKYIYGTEVPEYEKYLTPIGLKIEESPTKEGIFLGVSTRDTNGKLLIRSVRTGSAAYEGGLNANDEIIAIDGFRVDEKEMDRILDMKKPGDQVVFTLSRDNILMNLTIGMQADQKTQYTVTKVEDPSASQSALFDKWLRI